jgi:glycosyltransferase involved in cell wall biosynthesis
MNIVFYIGPSWVPWDHNSIKTFGSGGSEIAADQMSQLLAKAGHEVFIYNEPVSEGKQDNVIYQHHSKFRNLVGDVLIASRTPGAVDDVFNNKFKKKILWAHDVHFYSSHTPERAAKFDLTWCLSQWHKDFFCRYYPFAKNVEITRNGISLDLYKTTAIIRDPFRFIYSSSPNRGLQHACSIFKKIKKQVPQANFQVYCGFENWEKSLKKNPNKNEELEMRLIKGIAESTDGLTMHGRVSPTELAEAQLSSSYFLYPTFWAETSCISQMEVQAAGCYSLTSRLAALPETLNPNSGILFDGNPETIDYQKQMVNRAVDLLNGKICIDRETIQRQAHQRFDWLGVCNEWIERLELR